MFVPQDLAHHVPRWWRLHASVITNLQDYSAVVTSLGRVVHSVGACWDVADMCVLKYVIQKNVHPAPRQVSRVVSVVNRKLCDLVLLQNGSVNR
jgi:hypothetical protein